MRAVVFVGARRLRYRLRLRGPRLRLGQADGPDDAITLLRQAHDRGVTFFDTAEAYDQHRATPAQVALAWILAKHPTHAPIPGTTKLHRLEENLAAASIVLPDDELAALDLAAARVEITGERYSPQLQQMIDR